MTKILISTTLAFLFGFLANQLVFKPKAIDASRKLTDNECSNLSEAKSNLITISQNEYIEYTQIKDLKLKYEKADEILGKVMLLFLADIGFRMQKQPQIETSQEVVSAPDSQSSEINANEKKSQPETRLDAIPENRAGLAGKSSVIKALSTEKQIRDALDEAIIENPKLAMEKGGIPTQLQIRTIEGRYSGVVRFFDTKKENLTVTWDFTPDYNSSGFAGNFALNIQGPSINSKSSRNGDIDEVVSLAEDKGGFLVNGCGDECFLQLYYNAPSDQFYGNFYEILKGSKTKSQRTGSVELKK